MTQISTALATARRNVVQRITRFIETLEQAPSELVALGELDLPRGEHAMIWAEWLPERRPPDAIMVLPEKKKAA